MAKKHYKCNDCNWKFSRINEPKLCPYCGSEKIRLDTSFGAAEELVKEIEAIEEQVSREKA